MNRPLVLPSSALIRAASPIEPSEAADGELSPEDFRVVAQFIERRLGIQTSDKKRHMLQARLLRRVRANGFDSFNAYVNFAFGPEGGEERNAVLDLATTNKTSFFREPEQLEVIERHVLPAIASELDRMRGGVIRLWSAACSSGQEPWTLAMMLDDLRLRRGAQWAPRVHGTDVSSMVLAEAERAIYREEDIEPVPAVFRKRYLLRSKDRSAGLVSIGPELREIVTFSKFNLVAPPYDVPSDFDVVLLRNVLIYFSTDIQRQIVARILSHVRPSGYLVVGVAESLHDHGLPLEPLGRSIYRRLA